MQFQNLNILEIASYLPTPAREVQEIIQESGGEREDYLNWKGWAKVCVARENESPSQMASIALNQALKKSSLSPEQIGLLISTGGSREFLPPYIVAAEVMRQLEIGSNCLGMDLLAGCVSGLAAFNLTESWLNTYGGQYAAIVSSESWSESIDFSNPKNRSLRGFSDGATAMIVGVDPKKTAIATFHKSIFSSDANQSQTLVGRAKSQKVQYSSEKIPYEMSLVDPKKAGAWDAYKTNYTKVIKGIIETSDEQPEWLICNQTSPSMIETLSQISGVPVENIIVTGHTYGHVGNGDIVLALDQLTRKNVIGNILIASSSPYSWGAGLLAAGS